MSTVTLADSHQKRIDRANAVMSSSSRSQVAAEIEYGICESPLGWLLLASCEGKIIRLMFADNQAELKHKYFTEYEGTHAVYAPDAHVNWLTAIQDYLAQNTKLPDLPLDLQGTEFQVRVWQCLRKIEYGHTATYSQIAQMMGMPNAQRAVANACGQNRIALLVPCHRIVRNGGGVSGYYWGVWRKVKLLELEGATK